MNTEAKTPSRAVEDYLKAIYKLQQLARSVSTTALADELGRSAASVTNMVKSMADQGLLQHVPYHGVRLTGRGETTALAIIRRHRVIEAYLIARLGYTWDGVHDEAERLEHAASDELVERMASALGDPDVDPHGAPIPSAEGRIARRDLERLTDLPAGAVAIVRQVADDDSERLRRLAALDLLLGAEVLVRGASGRGGAVIVEIGGRRRSVQPELAAVVRVERPAETKRDG